MNVQLPTQTRYEQLFSTYAASLDCPCSQISVSYGSFLEISSTLHQVCSSSFVDATWIKSLFGNNDWSTISNNEFRMHGVAYFSVLQSLCTIAQGKIITARPYFLTRQIISDHVIPENEFRSQINSDTDQIRRSFASTFVSLIQAARDFTQVNQLLSVYSLNWIYLPQYDLNMSYYRIPTQLVSHGQNCSCATSSTCTESIFIDGQLIPGFRLGCSSLESLLRSSLICLYNQTCLDLINIGNLSTINPLNDSLSSRFLPNMTVEELIPSMFLETWSSNLSYAAFFTQCHPLSCSYSVSQQKNTLQIITILLSIYGGLTMILRYIAPVLNNISIKIMNKFRRYQQAVVPFN